MRWPFSRRGRHDAADDPKESAWSTARFILILVILAWALRSFVVAPFSIPSGSMLPKRRAKLWMGKFALPGAKRRRRPPAAMLSDPKSLSTKSAAWKN